MKAQQPKTIRSKSIIVSWVGLTDLKILSAWLEAGGQPGLPGIESARVQPEYMPERQGCNGPVRTFTDGRDASVIYLLLSQEFAPYADAVRDWVRRGSAAECICVDTALADPTSYQSVYDALEHFFQTHLTGTDTDNPPKTQKAAKLTGRTADSGTDARPDTDRLTDARGPEWLFNLTPGTPATQAVMMYMSQVRYPGRAFRVVDPRFAAPDGTQVFEESLPIRLPLTAMTKSDPLPVLNDSDLHELMTIYAPVRAVNILLTGESGVGKSRLARILHEAAGGRDDNFIAVNCAELSISGDATLFRSELFGYRKGAFTGALHDQKGAFERAAGGTLFLDEIGEIPPDRQAMLLMALQERKIIPVGGDRIVAVGDVRIIAATNRNLIEEIRRGNFRADLYYRIAMYRLTLPSLAAIMLAAPEKFAACVREQLESISNEDKALRYRWTISDQAMSELMTHNWPGNVRELHHVLLLSCVYARHSGHTALSADDVSRHIVRMQTVLRTPGHASPQRPAETSGSPSGCGGSAGFAGDARTDFWELPGDLESWLETQKQEYVAEALRRSGGRVSEAARLLGMSYQKLDYYLKNLNNSKNLKNLK